MFVSIRRHNVLANILTGMSALALGAAWLFDRTGLTIPVAALLLLASSGTSLVLCLSRQREQADEMARVHEGASSSVALKALLLACALLCCVGTITRHAIELAPASCLCIGFGLLAYGVTFALLERDA